jgi:CheY-like chemotaxis protein
MKSKSIVLIVDDDKARRIMLQTLLPGWGYTTVEADDGDTAIEKV